MGKFIDLTGQRFGKLTVLRRDGSTSYGKPKWLCQCDCGNNVSVAARSLRKGETKSCGCARQDYFERRNNRGCKGNDYYRLWNAIRTRCTCETDMHYKDYGARGIKIADEWKTDFWSFYAYISNLDGFGEPNRSIDRIDNNRGYEPGNLRWATATEQARNRRGNKLLTAFGETKTIAEWAEASGMIYQTLWNRIYKKHWEPEKAISTPVKRADKKELRNERELLGRITST